MIMTTAEKAHAYDEALEKAKKLCEYPTTQPFVSTLEEIFPELKESEDERVREWLIDWANAVNWSKQFPVTKEQVLAWLEKQKPVEQQMYWTEEEIEPIISDYLCGREHYGGMIGRLCHLKPKQEWSEKDDEFLRRAINVTKSAYPMTADWLKSIRQKLKGE